MSDVTARSGDLWQQAQVCIQLKCVAASTPPVQAVQALTTYDPITP